MIVQKKGLFYLDIVRLLLYLFIVLQIWVFDELVSGVTALLLYIDLAIEFMLDIHYMETLLQRWSVATMCKQVLRRYELCPIEF